jgi:hypothetical protein
MLKSNTVLSAPYAKEIISAARAYKAASAKITSQGACGELGRAAVLCPSIYSGARAAAKNIAYRKLLPAEMARQRFFCLQRNFLKAELK